MSAQSLVALCAFIVLVICLCFYGYILNRKKIARERCHKILKDLYRSCESGGDRNAIKLFHEGMSLVIHSDVNFSHLGLLPGDTFVNAAYEAFCEYMTQWRRQHEQLEEDILELRKEELNTPMYLKQIARLGSALQKSQHELEVLEAEASRFYIVWIQPQDGNVDLDCDVEIGRA